MLVATAPPRWGVKYQRTTPSTLLGFGFGFPLPPANCQTTSNHYSARILDATFASFALIALLEECRSGAEHAALGGFGHDTSTERMDNDNARKPSGTTGRASNSVFLLSEPATTAHAEKYFHAAEGYLPRRSKIFDSFVNDNQKSRCHSTALLQPKRSA